MKRKNGHDSASGGSSLIQSCMLQMAMSNKYKEGRNDITLNLNRLCQCVLLRCSMENTKLKTWTRNKRHLFFSFRNNQNS